MTRVIRPKSRNELIIEAIVSGDSHQIAMIIEAPDTVFVAKRNISSKAEEVEINDIILKLYKSDIISEYDKLDILRRIILKEQNNSSYLNLPKVVDLNSKDQNNKSIINYVIINNYVQSLDYLITLGVDIENKQGSQNFSPLIIAILYKSGPCVNRLVDAGANLMVFCPPDQDNILITALRAGEENMAFYLNYESKGKLLKLRDNFGNDSLFYAQLYNAKRFLKTHLVGDENEYEFTVFCKKILELMYSQNDAPSRVSVNIEMIQKFIEIVKLRTPTQNPVDELPRSPYSVYKLPKSVEKYSKILGAAYKSFNEINNDFYGINNGVRWNSMIKFANSYAEIVLLPYIGHAAFVIIKYDQNKQPTELSYCDGNLPLSELNDQGYGFGEVCYKIKPEFLHGIDIAKTIIQTFEEYKVFDEDGRMDLDLLKSIFSAIVETYSETDAAGNKKETLRLTQQNIYTKPQKRGNCSIKSLNILLRALAKIQNNSLDFELEENGKIVVGGNGYEEYKEYKNFIIKKSLEFILDISQAVLNNNESVYPVVLESLKMAMLHSAAKDNSLLMIRIGKALENFGFSTDKISQLRNSKGQNIYNIAATKMALKSLSWCAKNQIANVRDNHNVTAYDVILNPANNSYENRKALEMLMQEDKIAQLDKDSMLNLASCALKYGQKDLFSKLMNFDNISYIFKKFENKKVSLTLAINATFHALNHKDEFPDLAQQMKEKVIMPILSEYREIMFADEKQKDSFLLKKQKDSFLLMVSDIAFVAVEYGNSDIVLEMIDAGLDLQVQNYRGKNLIEVIFNSNPSLLYEIIEKFPQKVTPDLLKMINEAAQNKMQKKSETVKNIRQDKSMEEVMQAKQQFYEYRKLSELCDFLTQENPKKDMIITSKDAVVSNGMKYSIISEV